MKINFTPQQIQWASEHDWFISGTASEIIAKSDIVDCNVNPPRICGVDRAIHTNFKALREWAGY